MTAIDKRPVTKSAPSAEPSVAEGLRLRLHDPGEVRGQVDGAWWPRSLDLAAELPELIAEVVARGFDVRRVVYNLAAWDPAPRRLGLSNRVVRLGAFRTQSAERITLVDSSGWNRLELVVIPPQEEGSVAEQALAATA